MVYIELRLYLVDLTSGAMPIVMIEQAEMINSKFLNFIILQIIRVVNKIELMLRLEIKNEDKKYFYGLKF
jgi:hypothetical protein